MKRILERSFGLGRSVLGIKNGEHNEQLGVRYIIDLIEKYKVFGDIMISGNMFFSDGKIDSLKMPFIGQIDRKIKPVTANA